MRSGRPRQTLQFSGQLASDLTRAQDPRGFTGQVPSRSVDVGGGRDAAAGRIIDVYSRMFVSSA